MTLGISAALACAATLMGQPVPSIDVDVRVVTQEVVDELCTSPYRCGAVYFRLARGRGLILTAHPSDFPLLAHEACHAIQHGSGQVPSEGPCMTVQRQLIRGATC